MPVINLISIRVYDCKADPNPMSVILVINQVAGHHCGYLLSHRILLLCQYQITLLGDRSEWVYEWLNHVTTHDLDGQESNPDDLLTTASINTSQVFNVETKLLTNTFSMGRSRAFLTIACSSDKFCWTSGGMCVQQASMPSGSLQNNPTELSTVTVVDYWI